MELDESALFGVESCSVCGGYLFFCPWLNAITLISCSMDLEAGWNSQLRTVTEDVLESGKWKQCKVRIH